MSTTDHPSDDAGAIQRADQLPTAADDADTALSRAVELVAGTIQTIALAAAGLVEQVREDVIADHDGPPAADALSVAAQAALQLGQAADLWTGIGVGLSETRQRILAGADALRLLADGGSADQ